jgi:predicted transcriptional regulator
MSKEERDEKNLLQTNGEKERISTLFSQLERSISILIEALEEKNQLMSKVVEMDTHLREKEKTIGELQSQIRFALSRVEGILKDMERWVKNEP